MGGMQRCRPMKTLQQRKSKALLDSTAGTFHLLVMSVSCMRLNAEAGFGLRP